MLQGIDATGYSTKTCFGISESKRGGGHLHLGTVIQQLNMPDLLWIRRGGGGPDKYDKAQSTI